MGSMSKDEQNDIDAVIILNLIVKQLHHYNHHY